MTDGLIALSEDETVTSAIGAAELQLRQIGVVAGAYYLTPAFQSQVGKRTVVAHFGYPEDMANSFLDPDTFENDPIPDFVMREGRTMTWTQAIAGRSFSPAQQAFLEKSRAMGLIDGVAIPLFGPNGRNSYSGFSFGRRMTPEDEPLIRQAIDIAQFAHRKVCALVERDYRAKVAVSKREQEVLYWMARGKSNGDVATILGLSPATVDTFVRRLYAKLGVNDRISAVLEGMSRGLFKLG